jgi:hypothetical protein
VRWGERIGRETTAPVVLALRGQLGAGKSVLARAVARGAGVDGFLPSPTFNLLFRYQGTTSAVVHMDLYRIHDPDELKELAWDELGAEGGRAAPRGPLGGRAPRGRERSRPSTGDRAQGRQPAAATRLRVRGRVRGALTPLVSGLSRPEHAP